MYLIDKAYFVVDRVVDVLAEDPEAARTLHRDGPDAFGRERWEAFLVSANDLLRAKDRPVDGFFDALPTGVPGPLGDVLDLLRRGQPRADAFRARLVADPATVSTVDPLVPAIVRAVTHWSGGGRPVAVTHHRQNTLSRERIARLRGLLGGRLAGLRMGDSSVDLRVQVADLLAGAARKLASDELNGRGDPRLTALLRPYLDVLSVWGDEASWSRLAPAQDRVS